MIFSSCISAPFFIRTFINMKSFLLDIQQIFDRIGNGVLPSMVDRISYSRPKRWISLFIFLIFTVGTTNIFLLTWSPIMKRLEIKLKFFTIAALIFGNFHGMYVQSFTCLLNVLFLQSCSNLFFLLDVLMV